MSVLQTVIYLSILLLIGYATVFDQGDIFATLSAIPKAENGNGYAAGEFSSLIVWLFFANAISFITVCSLYVGLKRAEKCASNHTFVVDEDSAVQHGFGTNKIYANHDGKAINWALAPLSFVYILSFIVGFLSIAICIVFTLYFIGLISVPHEFLTFTIIWNSLFYVLSMTICDYRARSAFRRLACVRLSHKAPNGTAKADRPALKEAAERDVKELREILGDFERMIYYVDYPFLIGSVIIFMHKYFVLAEGGSYFYGFLAGAVAMHTILANCVSLYIANYEGDMATAAF